MDLTRKALVYVGDTPVEVTYEWMETRDDILIFYEYIIEGDDEIEQVVAIFKEWRYCVEWR